jgi:hypothetical protein
MCLFQAVICLFFVVVSTAHAQMLVYPKGMLNPRIPMIATSNDGATGKAFASKGVMLGYDFGMQLGDTSTGKMSFSWRCDLARAAKTPVLLTASNVALGIHVTAASEGRKVELVWMTLPKTEPRLAVNSTIKTASSDAVSTDQWRDVSVTWDKQNVLLSLAGEVVCTLPVIRPFAPTGLWVDGWGVDELTMSAEGKLVLDWQQDYAARLSPANGLSAEALTADLLGFDSFVVGSDPDSRDYPMLQINNASDQPQQITASFNVKRELAGKPWQWQQALTVGPKQTLLTPIAFPETLGSDVYHLAAGLNVAGRIITLKNKHFMHAPLRNEPAGPHKFGLHDCDVRSFGFWPDALPVHIAHNYLRWGYVQGPGWVKDWDGKYGLDPKVPADQWYWNHRIDWAIAAQRDMLVCVQSVPLSDWARASDYPHMRVTPWGKVGGQPNDEHYRNFLKEVAKRYAGKVQAWEIENEPNAGNHTPADRLGDYVAVCKAVYDELKAADPKTLIMGISGTSKFQDFMNDVFKLGGAPYMDGVTWHTYTSPDTPDAVGLPTILKESVDIVHKYKPGAPIWNSETGVYIALRNEVDHAIPMETVAQKVQQRDIAFVQNGWMGAAFDEWHGGACIVSNAVYNFLAGVEKYVFFGWNPDWPTQPQWQGRPTNFTLFSAAADGTRTPSLATLAVATLTTQMEGALIKGSVPVKLDGIAGGLFNKTNDGRLAILWAPQGRRSVMLHCNADVIEVVDMLGQSQQVKTSSGMAVLDVQELPVYVHVPSHDLIVSPGPVDQITVKSDGATTGQCEVTLTNRLAHAMVGKVQLAWYAGNGKLTPMTQSLNLAPGKTQTLGFAYEVTSDLQTVKHPTVLVKVMQDATGGQVLMQFASTVAIPTKAVLAVPVTSSSIAMLRNQKAMVNQMKQVGALELKLDRLEQVQLGHPPALASLQDDKWWGGPDELSATVQLAADDQGLVLYMDVLDIAAREPQTWPSVKGSVVELFFDFREPGKGLGDGVYGRQTFQVLLKPILGPEVTDAAVWSPQLDKLHASAYSQYDKASGRYWVAMRLPWSVVPGVGNRDKAITKEGLIGFDLAINAAPAGGPGRKTQMILFGTAANARNASAFGQLLFKP